MRHGGWILFALVITTLLSWLPVSSSPGDRVAYTPRPYHDRLSSATHRKHSTAMRLATYSTHGRMSKSDKLRIDKRFKGQHQGGYVRATSAYYAVRSFDLPIFPNTSTANATVFGFGDTSVPTYGRSQAYDDDFGWQWSKTLQRIDYTYERAAGLGAKVMKTAAHFNTHDPLSEPGGTLVLDGSEGWEGVDRAVAQARKYGMKLTLYPAAPKPGTLELWGMGSAYNFRTMMDNWWLPYFRYMATRYANDYDVVQLQPINEMQTLIQLADYVNFQVEMYDAAKAIAPSLTVIAAGFFHVWSLPYENSLMAFIDNLGSAGKMNKFDLCVDVHLYPSQDIMKQYGGRANIDPYVGPGQGGPQDIVDIIAKLDAYSIGKKVRIGEFGTFGFDRPASAAWTEEETATDLTETWNYYKDNARIDSLLFWVTWGLETDKPTQLISGIGGLVGQPGMGIWVDNTDLAVTKPAASTSRSVLVADPYGNPVDSDMEWATGGPANLMTQTTSYGDVNRSVQRRANGTAGKPTAVLSNEIIGTIGFRGHTGSAFSTANRAQVQARATEDYTATTQGTQLEFIRTANGTTAPIVSMVVENTGNVRINRDVAAEAMLDVNGSIKSQSTGFIFPDATTQSTAAKFSNGSAGNIQKSDGSGGFASSDYLKATGADGATLTVTDLLWSNNLPQTFVKNSLTATDTDKPPAAAITNALHLRIPVPGTAGYIPFGASATTYTTDSAFFWDNTAKRLIIGVNGTTHQLEINNSANGNIGGRAFNTDSTGTAAVGQWVAKSDSAQVQIISHGSGRTATRYGITVGGWNELQGGTGSGLLIGTNTAATPIVFGTNSTEKMRIASDGRVTYSNSGGHMMGSMSLDNPVTITVGASNTWYEIDSGATDFVPGKLTGGVTLTDHYLTVPVAQTCMVIVGASVRSAVAAQEVAIGLMVNGTIESKCHGHATSTTATQHFHAGCSTTVSVPANGQLSIATLNHDGANNITVNHADLSFSCTAAP